MCETMMQVCSLYEIEYSGVEYIVNEITLNQLECVVRGLWYQYRVPVEEYYFNCKTIVSTEEECGGRRRR